jgi:hypothetical protein
MNEPNTVESKLDVGVCVVAPSAANLAMERYADGDEPAFSELYDILAPR